MMFHHVVGLLFVLVCVIPLCDGIDIRHRLSHHLGSLSQADDTNSLYVDVGVGVGVGVTNQEKYKNAKELVIEMNKRVAQKLCASPIYWHYTKFEAAKTIVESMKMNSYTRTEVLFTKFGPDKQLFDVFYNNFGAWNKDAVEKMAWVIGICVPPASSKLFKDYLVDTSGQRTRANGRWSDQWYVSTGGKDTDWDMSRVPGLQIAYAKTGSPIKFDDEWKERFSVLDALKQDWDPYKDIPDRYACQQVCVRTPQSDADEEEKEAPSAYKVGAHVIFKAKETDSGPCIGEIIKIDQDKLQIKCIQAKTDKEKLKETKLICAKYWSSGFVKNNVPIISTEIVD